MFRRKQNNSSPADEHLSSDVSLRMAPKSPHEALKPSPAPPPPPRVRKVRGGLLSAISGLLTLILVFAICAIGGFVFINQKAKTPGPLSQNKVIFIERNSGTDEIADQLQKEGVIDQPTLFQFYALMNRQRGSLKAGEFEFKARASIDETIDTLVQGKAILHSVTLPEGLTSEQMVSRLNENEILSGDVEEMPREGTLLPDTYKFERGTTRQQLIQKIQATQKQMVAQIWARRSSDIPVKTSQEFVILASIVEKETGKAEERPRVAGVFINRLNKKMRLQSDPTIVYGLVGGKGTLGRSILRSEIERVTPYNTYTIDGLPLGPIANPGRAALEAVANPLRTKELYFVADGTGGHVFAATYDEHLRNVSRWRQIEKGKEASRPGSVDRVEPVETKGDTGSLGTPISGQPTAFTQNQEPDLSAYPMPEGGRKPRGFDAVEGTARDPLRNRTYDLNSPKTVPNMKR